MITELLQATNAKLKKIFEQAKETMQRNATFAAHPQMVETILIDHYGLPTPIKEIANIDVAGSSSLKITPWDKKNLIAIEKGIYAHNKKTNKNNLQPQNSGDFVMVTLPLLTSERRQEVVKEFKELFEQTKQKILEIRRSGNEKIKKSKEHLSEDEQKKGSEEIQKNVDNTLKELKIFLQKKSGEVMRV